MSDYQPVAWNETFETGIDDIDTQHRNLLDSFNKANARLAVETKFPIKSNATLMTDIVRDLLMYAQYHFETEEALMEKYGYLEARADEANEHIRQHREFSAKATAMRDELKAGRLLSREDMLSFLSHWLTTHILSTDKTLTAFLLASDRYLADNRIR